MRTRGATSSSTPESTPPSTRRPSDRLQERLPEAGFPRGVGVPSTIGFVLLVLVACFCALALGTGSPLAVRDGDSPAGVATARRHDAEALAKTVAASATSTAHDLRIAAGSHVLDDPDTGRLLTALSTVYPSWRGTALIDTGSRTLVAARGEPVPLDALAGVGLGRLTVRPVARSGDVPLVLSAVPLTGVRAGQALVVTTALRLTVPPSDEFVRLVSADGTVLGDVGSEIPTDVGDLLRTAASAAPAGSGVLTGATTTGPRPVVPVIAYAPVSTGAADGGLGLAVVTATWLPADTAPARWPGLGPAAALLALATAGTLLLRRGLVAPIRRLRADALAVASGDRDAPVRASRPTEARRTAVALERCRRRLRGDPDTHSPSRHRSVPARVLVGLVTAGLLLWSGAVLLTLGQQRSDVPAALVTEQGLRLDRSADALRSAVAGSLAELRAAARLAGGTPPDQLQPLVDQLAADPAFRSVYTTSRDGSVHQRGGRKPLRDGVLPTDGSGLHQHNTSGRVPVVYAYAGLSGGRTLVGELDITRLVAPLQPEGARVRVVDGGDRTIVDTRGYLALDRLPEPALRAATAEVRDGHSLGRVDGVTLVTARAVARTGAAAALDWVVVAEDPLGANNSVRDGARAAALVVVVLALLLGGWHELVVVRPLRRVAEAAELVTAGTRAGDGHPQRQDEIGTVASCVELCGREPAAVPAIPPRPALALDRITAPLAEQVAK